METRAHAPSTDPAPARAMAVTAWWSRLRGVLPEGIELPKATWELRHNIILTVIALQAVALALFGIYQGWGIVLPLVEALFIGALGLLASPSVFSRRFRSAASALACVTCSAVLVQFSGGMIEAHFHFFVMVALVALYQDWIPFLLTVLYVAADHGIVGSVAPQLVYNHPDGVAQPWKWALIHASMVLAECGALIIFWGGAEQAKARSDLVLESAGEGIIGLGLDKRITFINRAGSALLGWPADALLGLPLTMVTDTQGRAIVFPVVARGSPRPPRTPSVEGVIRRGDGTAGHVAWVVTPTMRVGVPVGYVVAMRDISERKRAERELRSSVTMLAAALESTADGILVVDGEGGITSNSRFLEMWNIPSEMAAARRELVIPMATAQLRDPSAMLRLATDQSPETTDVLELRDGRVFEAVCKPQRIEGTRPGRVWSFRDVTQRRRNEEARAAQMAALQEAERIRAQQDRFKTQLLNTASHELNTPISALQLQLHALREQLGPNLDVGTERGLDLLGRNIERLGVLVRDTMDVAHIEDGSLRLDAQVVDLARMAGDAVHSMEGLAAEKEIALELEDQTPLFITGDPERLTQVLFNLLANAIKFTPEVGKVKIKVSAVNGQARVEVRDSGIGIDRASLDRLFQPFTQLHDSHALRGSGLGLYICRGIVEHHGGRIWCESAGVGKGTAFLFELPLTLQPGTAPASLGAGQVRMVSAGTPESRLRVVPAPQVQSQYTPS